MLDVFFPRSDSSHSRFDLLSNYLSPKRHFFYSRRLIVVFILLRKKNNILPIRTQFQRRFFNFFFFQLLGKQSSATKIQVASWEVFIFLLFRNQQIVTQCDVACRVAVIDKKPAADGMVQYRIP